MNAFKNSLPMAVHQVGGGEASKRTGSLIIPLNGVNSGSFSTGTAGRIRVFANLRTTYDIVVIVSYDVQTMPNNAEYALLDREFMNDSLLGPVTVYYKLIDMVSLTDRNGGQHDYLCVTFYE